LNFGAWLAHHWKISVISRRLGRGGKMYVPRATYSLRMSFWIVPSRPAGATPCFSATATYMASRIMAGELMVMEVEIASRGIRSNRTSMSARVSMATPTLPTSPRDRDRPSHSRSGWEGQRPRKARSGPGPGDNGSGGWTRRRWSSRHTGAWSTAGLGTWSAARPWCKDSGRESRAGSGSRRSAPREALAAGPLLRRAG
jgi:hypothetical protein